MRPHHVVGGSTGPGYGLMHFDLQEKKNYWAKMRQVSSGISSAI